MTRSECLYHPARAFTSREAGVGLSHRYMCCREPAGSSPGCSIAKRHVAHHVDLSKGFVSTGDSKSNKAPPGRRVYALDCEMVYTLAGFEVAKVTVIDHRLKCVYETLIVPCAKVVDLNTRFSGITEAMFQGVETDLADAQRRLLQIIAPDTILIGHSLESDLLALKLCHRWCIDTSIVYPHRRGAPFKRALRTLMREVLHRVIQEDDSGHDSREDADACMQLMLEMAKKRRKELSAAHVGIRYKS